MKVTYKDRFKKSILITSCIILCTACDFSKDENPYIEVDNESIWLLDSIVKVDSIQLKTVFPIVVFSDIVIPHLNFYPIMMEDKQNNTFQITQKSYLLREEFNRLQKNNFFDAKNEKILGYGLKVEYENDSSMLIRVLDKDNYLYKSEFLLKKVDGINRDSIVQNKIYWTAEDEAYYYEIGAHELNGINSYFGFRLNKKDSTWNMTYHSQSHTSAVFPFYSHHTGLDYLLPLSNNKEKMEVISMSLDEKKTLDFTSKMFEWKNKESVSIAINAVWDSLKISYKREEPSRIKKIGPLRFKSYGREFYMTPSKQFLFELDTNRSSYSNNMRFIEGAREDLFILKQ